MNCNLKGLRFGRLLVERFSYREPTTRHRFWLCKCDCGREKIVSQDSLKKKNGTKSCGCISRSLIKSRNTTHGLSGTRVHRCWQSINHRVNYKGSKDYRHYSKLGMDPRWKEFKNFLKDMGLPPSNKHTVDRKDNKKGYWKSNCRWATHTEQMQNRDKFRTNKSGYLGVYKRRGMNKWTSRLTFNKKNYHIGYFYTAKAASDARIKKLKELRGY